MELTSHILLLFLPLIIGNILHMIIVKKDLLKRLAIPIAPLVLGENKTVRAFIILPVLTGLIALLISKMMGPFGHYHGSDFIIGFGLGFVYLLSELPNSYIKRRLGITSGSYSKRYRLIQIIIDRLDSLIGVFAFYFLVTNISFDDLLILFIWAVLISFTIAYLLVRLKIKKSL